MGIASPGVDGREDEWEEILLENSPVPLPLVPSRFSDLFSHICAIFTDPSPESSTIDLESFIEEEPVNGASLAQGWSGSHPVDVAEDKLDVVGCLPTAPAVCDEARQ